MADKLDELLVLLESLKLEKKIPQVDWQRRSLTEIFSYTTQ